MGAYTDDINVPIQSQAGGGTGALLTRDWVINQRPKSTSPIAQVPPWVWLVGIGAVALWMLRKKGR